MPGNPADLPPDGQRRAIRSVAHDLGNLSYRLTFLIQNLQAQNADACSRAEAVTLLEDTAARLDQLIEKLREVEKHV